MKLLRRSSLSLIPILFACHSPVRDTRCGSGSGSPDCLSLVLDVRCDSAPIRARSGLPGDKSCSVHARSPRHGHLQLGVLRDDKSFQLIAEKEVNARRESTIPLDRNTLGERPRRLCALFTDQPGSGWQGPACSEAELPLSPDCQGKGEGGGGNGSGGSGGGSGGSGGGSGSSGGGGGGSGGSGGTKDSTKPVGPDKGDCAPGSFQPWSKEGRTLYVFPL